MTHARLRSWLVCALAAFALSAVTSRAHAFAVVVPGDFATIQAAVDSLRFNVGIDTIYVSPGVVEDSVYADLQLEFAIIGLGDSLTRPRIRAMRAGGGYSLLTLANLHLYGEFQTGGKANVLFESCRIEGGLRSPIQGSLRILEFRHCIVTSRMIFGSDSFVNIDSCGFEGGSVRKEEEGELTVLHSTFHGPSPLVAIDGAGDARLEVEDVRITGYAYGILQVGFSGSLMARSNHIENCGTGISLRNEHGSIVGNTIIGSVTNGLACDTYASVTIDHNVVLGSGARGILLEAQEFSDTRLLSNTVANNFGAGFDLQLQPSTHYPPAVIVNKNIGHGNREGLRISGDMAELNMSCNDWFANDSAAVVGVSPSVTDVFVDPQFCDLDQNDVRLMDSSPLVDAPGCGLIGALGVGCANTATLVTLFTAERDAEGVRVRWQLADPTRLAEVWVERADVAWGPWSRVSTELTTDGGLSVALDRSALAEREYWYRLVARENAEVAVIGAPVSVLGNVAQRFELTRVTPNPGFGPLRINFTLPREAAVQLDVLDLQGRHVAALVRGSLVAGTHEVEWSGRSTKPGMYFVEYRYPGGRQMRRVVRVR